MIKSMTWGIVFVALASSPLLAQPASPPSATRHVQGVAPPPPPGKALVVFFRPARLFYSLDWYNVRENGVILGKLTNGAFIVQVADPGPHTYTAATENRNTLHLEVDDGETYYINATLQMGFLVGEPELTPSDHASFERALKHMHQVFPTNVIVIDDRLPRPMSSK